MQLLTVFILGALLLGASPIPAAEQIEGVATRLSDGVPVYRELHRIGPRNHQIAYEDPTGALIASLELDYRCSDIAPDFHQRDLRSGGQQLGRWDGDRFVVASNAGSQEPLRSKPLATPAGAAPLVASSGFDRFLRARWERLLGGETLSLRFAMPARLSAIGLRARHDPTRADGLNWFVIEPEQALLRVFVKPIEVAYDDSQRLAVYRGLSNLTDTDGSALEVDIRYSLAATPQVASSEPEAAAARITGHSLCTPETT